MESSASTGRLLKLAAFSRVGSVDELLQAAADAQFVVAESQTQRIDLPQFVGFAPEQAQQCYDAGGPWIAIPDVWIPLDGRRPVPDLTLTKLHAARVYGGAMTRLNNSKPHRHWSGQLLTTSRDEIFADSYGILDGALSLPGDLVAGTEKESFLTYEGDYETLTGRYLFIGSVHSHFGHVMLEGLSRLWALACLPEAAREGLRLLVYEPSLPGFAGRLLERLGFGADRIVHAPTAASVEELLVPSPAMRTHVWIRSRQAQLWQAIAAAVEPTSPHGSKIYLSRRHVSNRALSNELDLERVFEAAGYQVLHPETLSIDQQIEAVRNAQSLAGCVGSAMYLSAFQKPGGRNIVVAPRNFFLNDDVLLSNAVGHELTVILGSVRAPWSEAAPWTCDLDQVRDTLSTLRLS